MNGYEDVPKGDPDGFGHARIKINVDEGKICVREQVWGIELPATGAHIHKALRGAAGPIVVGLPIPDSNGKAWGCVDIDKNVAQNIVDNPHEYYINSHNTAYPAGAVRGQLF